MTPITLPERAPNAVRVLIQDNTHLETAARPPLKVTDIPLGGVTMIDEQQAGRMKRALKQHAKKNGPMMAIVGALLLAQHVGGLPSADHAQLPLFAGAITSAIATSWKAEIGVGTHNFTASTGDTVKCALYTSSATLGASTTAYSATNEITGTGYTAGGVTMANSTPTTSGTTAIFDWADAQWTSSSFTANGCLVYNSSKSNKAIFVIAFGSDQTVTSGTFTIQWPTPDASNAIIRIA
jgi:hypothetical protein